MEGPRDWVGVLMARAYQVTHRTDYRYEQDVTASYGQLHLLPRDLDRQRRRSATITLTPGPDVLNSRQDFFGNSVSYFEIHEPHRTLTVTAQSVVEVADSAGEMTLLSGRIWEDAVAAVAASSLPEHLEATQFVLGSPLAAPGDRYRGYALESFPEGRPLLECVESLCARIHADFRYEPGSTSVATPLTEVFRRRRGVCQDFAHLGIACLRSLGLPARYVSGYLETRPAPGRPKLTGVDGSHAWFSVLVPGAGWLDVDPTNDQFVNDRYVVTAYGRDYGDVPPLGGVIYTEGKTDALKVAVDVVPIG
jgi:transglutaminase-like putative cysteine protease